MLAKRRTRQRPKGMTTLEVVMTTALIFVPIAIMALLGINALRALYMFIGSMLGSPLL